MTAGDPFFGVNLLVREGQLGCPNPAANPVGVRQAYVDSNESLVRFFVPIIRGDDEMRSRNESNWAYMDEYPRCNGGVLMPEYYTGKQKDAHSRGLGRRLLNMVPFLNQF